jgi:hypothetical protein
MMPSSASRGPARQRQVRAKHCVVKPTEAREWLCTPTVAGARYRHWLGTRIPTPKRQQQRPSTAALFEMCEILGVHVLHTASSKYLIDMIFQSNPSKNASTARGDGRPGGASRDVPRPSSPAWSLAHRHAKSQAVSQLPSRTAFAVSNLRAARSTSKLSSSSDSGSHSLRSAAKKSPPYT